MWNRGIFSSKKLISGEQYYGAHSRMKHRGPDDEGFVVIENERHIFYDGKSSQSAFAGR